MTTADLTGSMDGPETLRVVFHPRADTAPPDPDHDITLAVEEDISLGGKLYLAAPSAPLVVFFHGNGEIASDYADIAPAYNRLGLSFLVVDYRGYGRSNGTPTLGNLLADARHVWDTLPALLAARGSEPERFYVMGRSLGSASALDIANHAKGSLAGLIIESGFAFSMSLIARLGGPVIAEHDDGRSGLAHICKAEQVAVPTLIIHGEADWIIPVADAHALHAACGATDKRLILVPGAGHNDLLWLGQEMYFEAIRAFTESGDEASV